MEPVGLLGIIKLTWKIILNNCKHFLIIAFLLALPYAFDWIVLDPSFKSNAIQHTIASISMLCRLLTSRNPLPCPDLPPPPTLQPYPLSLLIAISIFSLVIFLLCKPLLTVSVCRSCLNESLGLKGSLLAIPRTVLNLFLTAVCKIAMLFVFTAAAMVVMLIIAAVVFGMNANPAIPISIWAVEMVIGQVYLAISFSLADTVAILEEKKGWEAMRRSMYLLGGGRKWLAFGLSCLFSVFFMLLPISASKEASLLWRWSAAAVTVSLQAFIAMFSMCAYVVLYMSCKSLRNERLDTLIAASAQFGPQQHSAKYLDLETAALHSPVL